MENNIRLINCMTCNHYICKYNNKILCSNLKKCHKNRIPEINIDKNKFFIIKNCPKNNQLLKEI